MILLILAMNSRIFMLLVILAWSFTIFMIITFDKFFTTYLIRHILYLEEVLPRKLDAGTTIL